MGSLFDMLSLAASAVGWPSLIFGLMPPYRVSGVFAIATGCNGIEAALNGATLRAPIMAACCALGAWQWWTGGGGDGTRRRLRSLARAFRGVRRTAPVTGGAS